MCDEHNGTYAAWFFDSLNKKDWTLNKKVRVTSDRCVWLNVCPEEATGDGEKYSVVTGTTSLMVSQTGWNANFGGNYFIGTPTKDQAMLIQPRETHATVEDGGRPSATALRPSFPNILETSLAAKDEGQPERFIADLSTAEERRHFLMSPLPSERIIKTTFHPTAPRGAQTQGPVFAVAQPSSTQLPCDTLCDPQNPTPYCVSLTLGGTSKDAFLQLFNLAHDQGVALYPHDLVLGLFDVAKDPCGRSDTTISNGVISNIGGGCLVTTQSTVGSLNLAATLNVPTMLSGNITRAADTETIDFANPATALTLGFSDTGLESDFGGRITKLTARRDRLIWQTDKRCIAVSLQ